MTFWFSETKISPKVAHFRGPQNSSIPREGPLETVPFLQKILIFGTLKTVPSLVKGREIRFTFCPFYQKMTRFWTVSNGPSRGMEPFWVTRKWSIFGWNLCNRHTDGQTDRHWTNIKIRDVTLISRTGSTIAPFGGNYLELCLKESNRFITSVRLRTFLKLKKISKFG